MRNKALAARMNFIAEKMYPTLSDGEIARTIARIQNLRKQTAADRRELDTLLRMQAERAASK